MTRHTHFRTKYSKCLAGTIPFSLPYVSYFCALYFLTFHLLPSDFATASGPFRPYRIAYRPTPGGAYTPYYHGYQVPRSSYRGNYYHYPSSFHDKVSYIQSSSTYDTSHRDTGEQYEELRAQPSLDLHGADTPVQNQAGHQGEFISGDQLNLATHARIWTNATCGERGPEYYCRLSDHVRQQRLNEQIQCGICDGSSANPSERHPIEHAVDGSNNWWQSPTITNGKRYNWVTVTLDLKQVYQVAYVVVKAANSPRPGNWILERSLDGVTFSPWQYFAETNSDCYNVYGITASVGAKPRSVRDDQVHCTSHFSQLDPLEHGEIIVSLINGRPGADSFSRQLVEFTKARYVRLRLQKIRTLLGDLMTFVYNDEKDLDPTVTDRYYYSMKDISIGGQCICNGTATRCHINPTTGQNRCDCGNNVCGSNCDECCPLFNQEPARIDPHTGQPICVACNCFGHANACVYNATVAQQQRSLNLYGEYSGGGVCIGCKHHTQGVNCEECIDGYFWPSGVDPYSPTACVPCDCDYIGSTGVCVKDDSQYKQGLFAGDCVCREGYCGPNCDQCATGYTGYPYCERCACDPAGSINSNNLCFGTCWCKPHVCGVWCDVCQPGYYNLQADNPSGCDRCFCFGLSDECYTSQWGADCIISLEGWRLTDLAASGHMFPSRGDDGTLVVTSQQVRAHRLNRATYWLAPHEFTGNKIMSYGGVFEYAFSFSANPQSTYADPYLGNYDIILEGSRLRLGYGGQYYSEDEIHHVTLLFTENGWRHLEGSTSLPQTLVPREEFLTVLAQLDRLLIRASYHVDQTESFLHGVSMEVAHKDSRGPRMSAVEVCACPPGYAGSSCEQCARGYRRVGSLLLGSTCEPCQCNGHADTCDYVTGECYDCRDNTRGLHCELCMEGFSMDAYGRCTSCPCPMDQPTNNFADECVPTTGGYSCACRPGYTGEHCERCSEGYFGDPMLPGDWCKPCDCTGNSASCDPILGQCFGCQGNTDGFYCEGCVPGFYGSARNGDCSPCGCNSYGAANPSTCDSVSGQCKCRPLYTGRDCGQCVRGYGKILAGCVRCQCEPRGCVDRSATCDPVTGQCVCKPGVGGVDCGKCLPGYYGFGEAQGCRACRCHPKGSISTDCDDRGQCNCHLGVTGSACDTCLPDYWGLSSGLGCQACRCDPVGSSRAQCDPLSGQCPCRPGITGERCDECAPGYYGFSRFGCKECPICANAAQVCNPVTGQCACPPLTAQPDCARCVPGTWGYDPQRGCQECGCDDQGSEMDECDKNTGQCLCRSLYTGKKCNQCYQGYYGLPNCRYCGCDPDGTEPSDCDARGLCSCSGDTGRCRCRQHVTGNKCDQCAENAFGLQASNPRGCTRCFCSGRTDRCQQAPYKWFQARLLDQEFRVLVTSAGATVETNHQGVLPLSTGESLIERSQAGLPLYWNVPKYLLGDMSQSYGGVLKFVIESNGNRDAPFSAASTHPEVYLLGNHVLRLVYSPAVQNRNSRRTMHLHEDYWRDESGGHVTRHVLMAALVNVQTLLIKIADKTMASGTFRLHGIELDRAVEAGPGEPTSALGIEQCVCPVGYSGLSCQDPADGYYRVRPEPGSIDLTNLQVLIGYAEPCVCHGHAQSCYKETGICLGCDHHTSGKHCEVCAPGFYGDAKRGTPSDCLPCSCGSQPNATCHVSTNPFEDFICDSCPPGLSGDKCTLCAPGYYGDPRAPQGCIPCGCNPQGSRSIACNPVTGQCPCLRGIRGRVCSQCAPRAAVVDGRCEPCDVGCTGLLFDEIDTIQQQIIDINLTPDQLLPWLKMRDLERRVANLSRLEIIGPVKDIDFGDLVDDLYGITKQAADLEANAHIAEAEGEKVRVDARELLQQAQAVDLQMVRDVQRDVDQIIADLMQRLDSGDFNLRDALTRASAALAEIRSNNITMDRIQVERERRLADAALERVLMFKRDYTLDTSGAAESAKWIRDALNELLRAGAETNNITSHVLVMNKDNEAAIWRLQEVQRQLEEGEADVRDTTEQARDVLQLARQANDDTAANILVVQDVADQLFFDVPAISSRVSALRAANEKLRAPVQRAVDHANALAALANTLQQQFEDTREQSRDPVNAAKAFERMVEAVRSAEEALRQAQEAVRNVTEVLGGGNGLKQRAADSRRRSQILNEEVEYVKSGIAGLGPALQGHRDRLADVQRQVEDGNKLLKRFKDAMEGVDFDLTSDIENLRYIAMDTHARSQAILNKAKTMNEAMTESLMPKLQEMQQFNMDGLDEINDTLIQARANIRRTNVLTDDLEDRSSVISERMRQIQYDLDMLKDKIQQTREQANSIRVSLSHEDSCYRRYAVAAEPSTKNEIRLHFRLSRPLEKDSAMLLFLLADPHQSDFLALEVLGNRVRFSWDLGEGFSQVEHPEPIRYDFAEAEEDRWYEVVGRRIANMGLLTVSKLTSEAAKREVQFSGPSAYVTLNITEETDLFIGGVPDDYKLPSIVEATEFVGCIGDVTFGGKPIGLYNFRLLFGEGCLGCDLVPAPAPAQSSVYHFGGYSSYATMNQVRRYSSGTYFIELDFKTFWSDALLFFTHNPNTGDFISLELIKGRVVFKFSFRGLHTATLSTLSQYNTNTWVRVNAKRKDRTGTLEVESETVPRVEATDTSLRDLDLGDSVLNFAGVPLATRRYTQRYNIISTSFYGCMRNLQISSGGPFVQDLNTGLYSGMTSGCPTESAHVVGFAGGGGFLEMPNHDLHRNADVSMSFRTEEENGLLLLSRGSTPNAFYSLSLTSGYVELNINGGSGIRIVRSRRQYHDGRVHNVMVVKINRLVELYIDDVAEGTTRLPSGDSRIEALRMPEGGGLYLGGVPTGEDVADMAASLQSLRGCIMDVVIAQRLLSFDAPIAFYKADIGRCREQELFSNASAGGGGGGDGGGGGSWGEGGVRVMPTPEIPSFTVTVRRPDPPTLPSIGPTQPTASCAVPGPNSYLPDTVAFGGIKHSHASVSVRKRELSKEFNITLEFRTFYPRGLILYLANEEQTEYVAIEMVRGKVLVSYEGKNLGNDLESEGTLNDGLWHFMRIMKAEREMVIQVNGDLSIREEINRRLDVNSNILVGGIPATFTPREGLVSESFKGCMRGFNLNGSPIDLANSGAVSGFTQCFRHAERGAHFDGYSYAVFANDYVIKTDYIIKLDFKTTIRDGILVSISSNEFSAMTLEITQGQLQFTVVNTGDRYSARTEVCDYCLCDNHWHTVTADLIKNVVALQVDNEDVIYGRSSSEVRILNTDSSLYIGGMPVRELPQVAAAGSTFFYGCLRDLEFNNEPVTWDQMVSLYDVHVSACPVAP